MVKMHNLRRTAADVKAEQGDGGGKDQPTAYVAPEDDGARFELDHHHLTKMGLNGDLKSGDAMEFHGKGTVEKSDRFHKGGIDDAGTKDVSRDKTGNDLRGEIEKVHGQSEESSSLKGARSDSKIAEQAGGK